MFFRVTLPIAKDDPSKEGGCCGSSCGCWTEVTQVYISQFLSSWGDRMWMFAGGIFLMEVTPGSLRLAAIYGAALALTVIIGGAPIGRWVDRTSRLTAARLSLLVQNIMVCACAAILILITTRRSWFTIWDGWALVIAEIAVILTACLAQIGTLGTRLSIEKDWIIVICGKNEKKLANMNSVLRTVDLSTEVLAPVLVGTVMTFFGLAMGGIVIASWNVGSLIAEYSLLFNLYNGNADLQAKKTFVTEEVSSPKGSKIQLFVSRVKSACDAWHSYMSHPVRNAGFSLALMFITVLAFDNYSRAYVYESGVTESILGGLTAVASFSGMIGSIVFPYLRKHVGISKTGLIGFGWQTLTLSLCIVSVFAPGTPFKPEVLLGNNYKIQITNAYNSNITDNIKSSWNANMSALNAIINGTEDLFINASNFSTQKLLSEDDVNEAPVYTSVILFLSGIILSRFGLWLADLTVTQILQENVSEHERGAINGVQSSLNQTMDLARSILIIILPTRETFGFLIILSVCFVALSWMIFGVFVHQQSGKNGDGIKGMEPNKITKDKEEINEDEIVSPTNHVQV
ncbi:unnamed protein product [Meganyctiphanes norvegica]|uniref:Solute carrier family 40 member n=1 Tax=Meganyctiphanes norvegica TaxID=48144 RepID=A0AAV2Q5M8_MEGNR